MSSFSMKVSSAGATAVAARTAFQRANVPPHLRARSYDDARQEAAVAFIRCDGKPTSYAFTAATRQVIAWIFEYLREDKSHRNDGDYIRVEHVSISPTMTSGDDPESILIRREEAVEFEDMIDEIADIILVIMKSARKQKKGRAVDAAIRDANIILLALQGYTTAGIAHEIGTSRANAGIYLRLARQRIEDYLVSTK